MFDTDLSQQGYVANLTRLWAHSPESLAALSYVLKRAADTADLDPQERAVVVTASAATLGRLLLLPRLRLQGRGDGRRRGRGRGRVGRRRRALTSRERALAGWARRVVDDPNAIGPADVDTLRAAGLDDGQVFAVTVFVALRLAFSTVNDALGASPDEELAARTPDAVLAAVGYGRRPVAPRTDTPTRTDRCAAAAVEPRWASSPTLRAPGATVKSTMQDAQLTIGSVMKHGTTVHPDSEVVTATADGTRSRTYAELGPTHGAARARPAQPRHHRRPAGRDLHVEQRRAPRGLPRDPVDGRGAAHAQHPAVPRAARLHRQPRRGPGGHRRRLPGAAARPAPAAADDRRRTSWSPVPTPPRPTSTSLRAAGKEVLLYEDLLAGQPDDVRLARDGRARRRRHVLHQRHDRQPQGRRLQPPLDLAALAWRSAPATPPASTATTGSCRSCRCSTPTPGDCPTRR